MTTATAVPASLVTTNFARQLFVRGTDFLGPEEILKTFGSSLAIPEDQVPPIPFTEEELDRAKALGQCLELHEPISMLEMNRVLGNKLGDGALLYNTGRYEKEPFYATDKSSDWHWRLTTKTVIPDSAGENYLGQSLALARYLKTQVYAGQELPGIYAKAIAELKAREQELAKLMDEDCQKAALELANLAINQNCRETPSQVLQSIAMYQVVNGEYLLPNMWTWTNTRTSDGYLVRVVYADPHGVIVVRNDSRYSSGDLGVRFSRRA